MLPTSPWTYFSATPIAGEMPEHLLTDLFALGEGRRLLVAALLLDRVDPLSLVDEVVLQLAEGLERHPGPLDQRFGSPSDDLLAR